MLRLLSVAVALMAASQAGLSQDRGGEAPGPVAMPSELQRPQSSNVQDYWTPERMERAQPRGIPTLVVPDAQLSTSSDEAELPSGPPILVPGWSPEGDELPPVPGESYEINLDLEPLDASLETYGSEPTNPKTGP